MISKLSIILLLSVAIGCHKPIKNQAVALATPKAIDYSWLGMCHGKAGTYVVICNPPLAPAPQVCTFKPETGAITCALPSAIQPPTSLSITVK